MIDLLFVNGQYPDFAENVIKQGNIGLKDGKIKYVGNQRPEAKEVVDVSGRIVSPGFIDIHMHEENFHDEGKDYVIAQMMLEMGVTTAVGGNCGIQNQRLADFKSVINDNGGSPINYIMLAGYNSFRTELGIGRYDNASSEQRKIIKGKLLEELEEGAYGISFGIEYDPGITYAEIIEAIDGIEDTNLIVSAHYREDCLVDISSIEEMIKIAKEIPMKFQISHLSSCSAMGLMEESLITINKAIENNPRLDFDTYPYNAFSTRIGSTVFEDGCLEGWNKDYADILLTDEPYKDVRCTKEIFNNAREKYPDMLAVAFVMNESEIAAAIRNKNGMIASDAIIANGNGHPRAAGTFPRVLGKYVREDKVISLIDAIRKMTLEPAKRLELETKGRIGVGYDADITIFDPDTIIDGATFSDLHIKPIGIEYVLVNGQIAMKNNQTINNRLGKFISYK